MRDAETLTMSAKELDRLEIIGRVVERRLTQRAAAARLGLSLRHVDRYLVTPPDQRDFQAEANKLNEFVLIESEGFFDRMLGGARVVEKTSSSNQNAGE